jgi:hypothetical protein
VVGVPKISGRRRRRSSSSSISTIVVVVVVVIHVVDCCLTFEVGCSVNFNFSSGQRCKN